MSSKGYVPCDCLHTCQKEGKSSRLVTRRTRTRHEEVTQQLKEEDTHDQMLSTPDDQVDPSSSLSDTQITKPAIDITSLLLNYNNHLMSDLSLKDDKEQKAESYLKELRRSLMVCTALLHTTTGVSRIKIHHIITYLNHVMTYTADALGLVSTSKIVMPLEIRSITKQLAIEPVLFQTICCPSCFSQYDITDPKSICMYKESPRSRPCRTELRNVKGKPIQLYSTQSLIAWISSMMQIPKLENEFDAYATHVSPEGGYINDVWDSPLWKHFVDDQDRDRPFFSTPGNLGFSLFYDGFNPHGNKVAGQFHFLCFFCLYKTHNLSVN